MFNRLTNHHTFTISDLAVFVPVGEVWRDSYLGFSQFQQLYPNSPDKEYLHLAMKSEAVFSSIYSLPTRLSLARLFFERLVIYLQIKLF
jgi:hypothetical protein